MADVFRKAYRPLSDAEKQSIEVIKEAAAYLYARVDDLGAGREFSLAKTKIEEAVFWATKGVTA